MIFRFSTGFSCIIALKTELKMKTDGQNDLGSVGKLKKIAPLIVVALTAFIVRIIYLDAISTSSFFNYPLIDAAQYDEFATKLVFKGELPDGPFYQPPLYPLFLSLLYWIFGRNLFFARFVQILIGTINILLTYNLAKRVTNPKVAFGAGLAMALYGTMLFFEGELLAPVLIVLLNLLSVLIILRFFREPRKRRALAAGLLLGLSALAHPVVLVFAVLVAVYGAICLQRRDRGIRTAKILAFGGCFASGVALSILPCTIYNAGRGDLILISYNGGINFYLGTGADYESKVAVRPGRQWEDLFNQPKLQGWTRPSDQSRYFTSKAIGIIAADPKGYLLSLARKAGAFVNGNEIMRNQEIYPFRQYSKLFSILVWKYGLAFPFGLLFPLSFIGIVFALKQRNSELVIMALAVVSHALVLSLFFVTARYRINVIPFLVVLAATGVNSLIQTIKKGEFFAAGLMGMLFVAVLVLSNWRVGPMPRRFSADTYYDLGVEYRNRGNPNARLMFEMALKSDPDCVDAAVHLGACMDEEGDYPGAIRMYDGVLEKYPGDDYALTNKGIALFHMKRIDEAKEIAKNILERDPGNEFAVELMRKIKEDENSSTPRGEERPCEL
jgi:4-amino-4-deoxy-L-arabinose transferase-like glycosyltransferase